MSDLAVVNFEDALQSMFSKPRPSSIVCVDNVRRNVTHIVPPYITTSNEVNVLQFHPKRNIVVDYNKDEPRICVGSYSNGIILDDDYYNEVNAFLMRAVNDSVENDLSLVLTPEYSVPISCLRSFISTLHGNISSNQALFDIVKAGTLFVLCCESLSEPAFDELSDAFRKLGDRTIYMESPNISNRVRQRTVNVLFYVMKATFIVDGGRREYRLVIAPQLKTREMGASPRTDGKTFESLYMSTGKGIWYIGKKDSRRQFSSLICSDAFNGELLTKYKEVCQNNLQIIFHPQVNTYPHYSMMKYMHTDLIEIQIAQNNVETLIISCNWQRHTSLHSVNKSSQGQAPPLLAEPTTIDEPWSSLVFHADKVFTKNATVMDYNNAISTHARFGVEYCRSDRVGFWLFHPYTKEILYGLDFNDNLKSVKYCIVEDKTIRFHSLDRIDCVNPLAKTIKNNKLMDELAGLFHCPLTPDQSCEQSCSKFELDKLFFSIEWLYDEGTFSKYCVSEMFKLQRNGVLRISCRQFGNKSTRENFYSFMRVHRWLLFHMKTGYFYSEYGTDGYVFSNSDYHNVEFNIDLPISKDSDKRIQDKRELTIFHLRDATLDEAKRVYNTTKKDYLAKGGAKEDEAICDVPLIIVLYEDDGRDYAEYANYSAEYIQFAGMRSYPRIQDIDIIGLRSRVHQLGTTINPAQSFSSTSMTPLIPPSG